jgi:hypothetical protein
MSSYIQPRIEIDLGERLCPYVGILFPMELESQFDGNGPAWEFLICTESRIELENALKFWDLMGAASHIIHPIPGLHRTVERAPSVVWKVYEASQSSWVLSNAGMTSSTEHSRVLSTTSTHESSRSVMNRASVSLCTSS